MSANVLISSLLNGHLILLEPLPIHIEFDGYQYVARSFDIDVYGVGEDEMAALDDFRRSVVDYYLDLKNDDLGGPVKAHFEFLAARVKYTP